jgi:cellulose synthase/poly-beta-1,6-N-acetylglucosamine synthase-like glycosyltransferase
VERFSLVLVVVVVWFTSKSYSCTDSMRLHFHSRSIGAEEGEPAATRLLDSNHLCTLSAIIPAFKEATRVPQSLKGSLLAAVGHLKQYRRANAPFSLEIIVVDDGSPDGTAASVIQWTNHLSCTDRVRVVRLPCNMEKELLSRPECELLASHPCISSLSLYLIRNLQASRSGRVFTHG